MPKVSVIVPVFEPGRLIAPLIATLRHQAMPGVRALHIPNSGWPGRPRNVGLDAAAGEFVFFADLDDWLAPDALRRLYATATEHRADIVIGKVVGHGGRRVPHLSPVDRHGLTAADAPLGFPTPHKLFRRALLTRHGLRFPEGEQRLEDHLFIVPASFAAERISVLVSHPIYHWVQRPDRQNASRRRSPPDAHFDAVRALLAMVDERTEPGPARDRYHRHWYRGKVLPRLGRRQDPAYEAQVYTAARALIEDCFPPRLDEELAFNLRLRAKLVRRDDRAGLEALAAFESRLRARARAVHTRRRGCAVELEVTGRLRRAGKRAIAVTRRGELLRWEPPPELARSFGDDDRDVTEAPAFPRVTGRAWIDPERAAGGGPLPPGRYDVLATLSIAGFAAETEAQEDGAPFTITVPLTRRRLTARIARVLPGHTRWS